MRRNLLWAAALGGGLYWASKQPGGIHGVWNRFSDKLHKVQDSHDPLGTMRQEFMGSESNMNSRMNMSDDMDMDRSESMSMFEPLPEPPMQQTSHQQNRSPMMG